MNTYFTDSDYIITDTTDGIATMPTPDADDIAALFDTPPEPAGPRQIAAQRMRHRTAAVRVSFTWFGTRKALSNEIRDEMAEGFDAAGDYLSAGKKLIDTKSPVYRSLVKVKGQARKYWESQSLPYPEPGIRLIRQDRIDHFQAQMESYREDLREATANLQNHYSGIITQARERLGRLFDPADYPEDIRDKFAVNWDFPNVEPPDYLMELRPEIYEAERARVAAEFDKAVKMAEEDFASEFAQHITHICERLTSGEDGERKTFRDSTIANLGDFIARFKMLDFGSNEQLSQLVTRAEQAIKGKGARTLRGDGDLRIQVAAALSSVGTQLEGLAIAAPRRKVKRPTAATIAD